jgi:predicted metal-dependent peptidase
MDAFATEEVIAAQNPKQSTDPQNVRRNTNERKEEAKLRWRVAELSGCPVYRKDSGAEFPRIDGNQRR